MTGFIIQVEMGVVGSYGQPGAKHIREWTKPTPNGIPTVFPAASPGIQAYQSQSRNFANGPAKCLPKRPAWVGPGGNTLEILNPDPSSDMRIPRLEALHSLVEGPE